MVFSENDETKVNKETYIIGDYEQEQGTDDEADALIQDPKAMAMHDVELANNTLDSVVNLSTQEEPVQVKHLNFKLCNY